MTTPLLLSIDDSADDLLLLQLACEVAKVAFRLVTLDSGQKAINYLSAACAGRTLERMPLPDLVLLDLKMPGKSGFDVLAWVRAQPALRLLPIVVFTASVHAEDRTESLRLGANRFVVKPVGFEGLLALIRTIDRMLKAARVGTACVHEPLTHPALSLEHLSERLEEIDFAAADNPPQEAGG